MEGLRVTGRDPDPADGEADGEEKEAIGKKLRRKVGVGVGRKKREGGFHRDSFAAST